MNLLYKECKLSLSILTPLFLLFSLIVLIPNYPVALSGFFIAFGIFHSFQKAREAGDILFTALLPVPKRGVVTAKYLVTLVTEGAGLLLCSLFALIRSTCLQSLAPYAGATLLSANFTCLAMIVLIFGWFNVAFLGGFFRTAYRFGAPFVVFLSGTMLLIALSEVLPHLPGLAVLGETFGDGLSLRLCVFLASLAVSALATCLSYRVSVKRFLRIDL